MERTELIKEILTAYGLTAQDGLNLAEALDGIEVLNRRKRSKQSAECIAYFAGMVTGSLRAERTAISSESYR
jgi:hypothetical protein